MRAMEFLPCLQQEDSVELHSCALKMLSTPMQNANLTDKYLDYMPHFNLLIADVPLFELVPVQV